MDENLMKGAKPLYYHSPYGWPSVYPTEYDPRVRAEHAPSNDMMSNGNMDSMMDMMQEHMRVTNEIKQKVDKIDERLRRIEEMMK